MLTRFRSTYLKSKVISSACTLVMIRRHSAITSIDAQCNPRFRKQSQRSLVSKQTFRFLTYALRNWKIDMSEWTEAERSKFQEAAKQLKEYDEVSNLVYRIGEVKQEFQTLYNEIGKETGVPSVIGHNEVSTDPNIKEIEQALNKYEYIMNQIEDSLWKEKVGEELGYYLHLIYNEHCLAEHQHMFDKFNLQQYFK